MRIAVKQGAVFFFGLDILVLQNGIFNGNTNAVADQFKNIFKIVGKVPGLFTADSNYPKGTPLLAADGNVGQRNQLFFL